LSEVAHVRLDEPDRRAVLTVPALLGVGEVARLLGCSPRTVRRRIGEGTLPAVIEGGRLMIRGDELRAYVEALGRPGRGAASRRRARSSVGRFDFLRESAT
jgi:excisionase family DNA binding protein